MTSSNAAANAPCSITYANRQIGTRMLPSPYTINSNRTRRRSTKAVAAASMARAPRVGVTIAAAPDAQPAISDPGHPLGGRSTLMSAAEAATIENRVVNQWWLIWVQGPCDMTTHPSAMTAEIGAFF